MKSDISIALDLREIQSHVVGKNIRGMRLLTEKEKKFIKKGFAKGYRSIAARALELDDGSLIFILKKGYRLVWVNLPEEVIKKTKSTSSIIFVRELRGL